MSRARWTPTNYTDATAMKWVQGGHAYDMIGHWGGVRRDPEVLRRIQESGNGNESPYDDDRSTYNVYKCVFCGAFIPEYQGAQCWRASCKVLAEFLGKEW